MLRNYYFKKFYDDIYGNKDQFINAVSAWQPISIKQFIKNQEEEALDIDGEFDYISNYEHIYENNDFDNEQENELISYR